MRVKAKFPNRTKFGFYDTRRRYDGDEFVLSDPSHFSEKWMVKLDSFEFDEPKRRKRKESGAE